MNILDDDILDDDILVDQFDNPKVKQLQDLGFTHKQSLDIVEGFYNLYRALTYPDRMKKFIAQVDINEDSRQLIMETFEQIMKKGDKSKAIIADKLEGLRMFGHDHLHRFEAVVEFRPITLDSKLQKIAVSVVLTGDIENNFHTKPQTIDFQMTFKAFERMMNDLNDQQKEITSQISILKERLGDDIVVT